jgi:hypothetical protein
MMSLREHPLQSNPSYTNRIATTNMVKDLAMIRGTGRSARSQHTTTNGQEGAENRSDVKFRFLVRWTNEIDSHTN